MTTATKAQLRFVWDGSEDVDGPDDSVPRQFHLKGKHNQRTHGGNASHVPDVTDTVKTKTGAVQGVATDYQDYGGSGWLKLDVTDKKKWHKLDDLEVVNKGTGIGNEGVHTSTTSTTVGHDSPAVHKPVMTEHEANQWAANSAVKEPIYHFTNKTAAENIAKEGFRHTADQGVKGVGVFTTTHASFDQSDIGLMTLDKTNATRLKIKLNVKPEEVFTEDKRDHMKNGLAQVDAYQRFQAKFGRPPSPNEDMLVGLGYKTVKTIHEDGTIWHRVLDPSRMAVVGAESHTGQKLTLGTTSTPGSTKERVKLPHGEFDVTGRMTQGGVEWVKVDTTAKKKWYKQSDVTVAPTTVSVTAKTSSQSSGFDGSFQSVTTHERWKTKKALAADVLSKNAQSLSTSERKAVEKYTDSFTKNYEKINKGLRNGTTSWALPSLDKALDRSRLPENLLLKRGTHLTPTDRDVLGIKVGATFRDKGYVSTTLRSGQAGFGGFTTFHIKAKAGSRGLYVESIHESGEHEVILPRGSKFRVVSIKQNPAIEHNAAKIVELEYLDD